MTKEEELELRETVEALLAAIEDGDPLRIEHARYQARAMLDALACGEKSNHGTIEGIATRPIREGGVVFADAIKEICGEKATVTKRCLLPKRHQGAHDEDP